jgi:lysyl endopeptidase
MKLHLLRINAILSIAFLLFVSIAYSQISEGGRPISFTTSEQISSVFDSRRLPAPNMNQIAYEDQQNAESQFPEPDRMGVSVPVNLDMNNAGTWETLSDGSRLWRLKLTVSGALALGLYYDHFYLPEGGKFFLYNAAKTQIIGAFTSFNNHPSGLFATQFVQGEEVTLEYYEPLEVNEDAVISISEIAYAYRFIEFEETGTRDQSWPCMINVKCQEGNGWEDPIQGIARISIKIGFSYYWCSGSLINNTSNNRVPYFLTASHCGEGSSANDMLQWIFYFNYQASTCSGTYGSSGNSTTGCTLKANDPSASDAGSDFYLVQLTNTPPAAYNVYYNGWNRTNTPGDSGVCLHHPAGDIKKVSTYKTPMTSSTWWNGLPTHWRVVWATTVNGHSIMQGGSSGSPVFDQDQLIMGDLTGGYASNACDNPSPAWYGKIWYSWDQNGTTPSTRLKDWLDPTNTGITRQPGISSHILPPIVDFTADTDHILQGESIQFTDLTTGNPASSWSWSFPGGTPNASAQQNPTISYSSPGVFDVTLTVVNPDGTDTETKVDYITVDEVLAPVADFSASQVVITEGEMIDFTDLSTNTPIGWNWVFEGGEPISSFEQNPDSIVYAVPGIYDVSMTAANNGGSDTEEKLDYITVNAGTPPAADFYADVTEIQVGDTVNFYDLSTKDPTQWIWTFEGATPGNSGQQNPTGIVYPTVGTYDVQLRARNSFGYNIMLKTDYIIVGNVSVKDFNRNQGVFLYPNPSKGEVTLRLEKGMGTWELTGTVAVEVLNSTGVPVWTGKYDPSKGSLTIDLTGQPNGFYIVRVTEGNHDVLKKLSLIK